jgi:hypothetical protein
VPSTFSKAKPLRVPDTIPSGIGIREALKSMTFCQNGKRKLCG